MSREAIRIEIGKYAYTLVYTGEVDRESLDTLIQNAATRCIEYIDHEVDKLRIQCLAEKISEASSIPPDECLQIAQNMIQGKKQ